MEEIKVGEYIRTNYGEIGQYVGIDSKWAMYDYDFNGNKSSCKYNELVKHSPNIIDLIEVGDYVNGNKVFATNNRINDNGEKVILTENYDEWTDNGVISNKDIKTIVTKEQFKSVSYEV